MGSTLPSGPPSKPGVGSSRKCRHSSAWEVKLQLPLGGAWTPDEILVMNNIVDEAKGQYQICGPNAFNRHGFIDKIPIRIYAYNNQVSGQRTDREDLVKTPVDRGAVSGAPTTTSAAPARTTRSAAAPVSQCRSLNKKSRIGGPYSHSFCRSGLYQFRSNRVCRATSFRPMGGRFKRVIILHLAEMAQVGSSHLIQLL